MPDSRYGNQQFVELPVSVSHRFSVADKLESKPGLIDRPSAQLSKEHPSPYVWAAAFDALKRDTGKDFTKPGIWDVDPKNAEQAYFANRMPKAAADLKNLPAAIEVKGKGAIGDPAEVNKFLREYGIELEKTEMKIASILPVPCG